MFETKLVKFVAAVHRASINVAIRSLDFRMKKAEKVVDKAFEAAKGLDVLAKQTLKKADELRVASSTKYRDKVRQINAADNVLRNAKDDIEELTSTL